MVAAPALLVAPLAAVGTVILVLAAGGAHATLTSPACGAGGAAQQVGQIDLDAEQMGNAATIIDVTASRRLPPYAAVVALTTAYTESALVNSTVQADHDSEGLFQQRTSLYGAAVAASPVAATDAFLDRLLALPGWQTSPVGDDAQAVQRSAYPGRYQPHAPLAEQLTGLLWPTSAAATNSTAPSAPTSGATIPPVSPTYQAPAVCTGAGGAGTGPAGSNVADSATLPAGLTLTGPPAGQGAVRYALAQLGKPYAWGAAGPDAYDCSGLVQAAWAAVGVPLPRVSSAQARAGSPEPPDLAAAVSGDLVFIPGSDGTPAAPGHVGMVAGTVTTPTGVQLWLVQAPMTGLPVELTPAADWAGQIVAVRRPT